MTIKYLRENGPSTIEELPHRPTAAERHQGIWRFKASAGNSCRTHTVYYLKSHSKEQVIRAWCNANDVVDDVPKKQLAITLAEAGGRSWRKPIRTVLNDLYATDDAELASAPDDDGSREQRRSNARRQSDEPTLAQKVRRGTVDPESLTLSD